MTTLKEVKARFSADSYSQKDGVITVRRGFFYRHGGTAEAFADNVKATFPGVTIVDSGEVWKAFRGGASVAQQSHWFVKFRMRAEHAPQCGFKDGLPCVCSAGAPMRRDV